MRKSAAATRAYYRIWYKKNRAKKLRQMRAWHKRIRANPRLRTKYRAYYRKRSAAYRKKHPNRVRNYVRKSYYRHRAKMLAAARKTRKLHPRRFRAYQRKFDHLNPGRRLKAQRRHEKTLRARLTRKRWYKRNYAKVVARCHLRRCRLIRASAAVDRKAFLAKVRVLRSRRALRCYWCGKMTRLSTRHIDHIIPLCRRGKNSAENICCSCKRCNLSKGRKLPHEFLASCEREFAGKR